MQAEKLDFERVTAGLTTKSDKIRALSRHGVPTNSATAPSPMVATKHQTTIQPSRVTGDMRSPPTLSGNRRANQ